ncbi:MAG: ATP-binding protein [Planctomycetes bacterium]|nr:ATP-binding protein [Planctomycetota bacterium]
MAVQPKKLWDQYTGKALAEMQRGTGWWPAQPHPVRLEPPSDPFEPKTVNKWDCMVNGWEAAYHGGPIIHRNDEAVILAHDHVPYHDTESLVAIPVTQFPDDESTIPMADQLFHALLALDYPAAFELIGVGPQPEYDQALAAEILAAGDASRPIQAAITDWTEPYTAVQFVVREPDASLVEQQLRIHYPNSAVVCEQPAPSFEFNLSLREDTRTLGGTLALEGAYCFPLRTYGRYDPDPLTVAIAAMEELGRTDWAVLQVLFAPAHAAWADILHEATSNPYKPDQFMMELEKDEIRHVKQKFEHPLFAVSVRLLASRADVFKHLVAWSAQFDNPPHQRLLINQTDWHNGDPSLHERWQLQYGATHRCSYRPGMLLNSQELASLIHVPAVAIPAERLRRVTSRTRPAVKTTDEPASVILGENVHRGKVEVARIPAELRGRHCYIAGATGTGKTTLMMNMIMQDIDAGHGVGLLDPHGDLLKRVLRRIPKHRVNDVILFDPADEAYPFALNIIEATDEVERERILSETLMSLERYFPASWGPRLERILTNAINTVLSAKPGATLADVERILIDKHFRQQMIDRTTEPRWRDFWELQFIHMGKNVCDPVLNKLSPFLESRIVRNIICQPHSSIDFDELLNNRKILLANLSAGQVTEKVMNTLGSFLVTKIVNAAFRRASIPENERQPWYLYIDEFQNFMNVSVGFDRILAEARKYKLVLAGMANQFVGQLDEGVRAAVFGNVGVLVVFRLGVDDAQRVAKQLGAFEAEEILDLGLGEAIVRMERAKHSYNVQTFPDPEPPAEDPSSVIIQRMRKHYARPREEVERELAQDYPSGDHDNESGKPPGKQKGTSKRRRDPPVDPSEDDLVS